MDLKKINEFSAAKIYIRSLKLNFSDKDFEFPPQYDNIDIVYKPLNFKFQITSVDGGPNKLLRHGQYEYQIKVDKLIEEYVLFPINKKYDAYKGGGVDDIILLIHVLRKPFRDNLFDLEIDKNIGIIKECALRSKFKSIYLVFDFKNEVIRIW
ncbi:hypothetical protein GW933_00225 [Candidatus Falkowbacteria bacterium]|uniref:Uncharacterized protein n=1 Tax=Candidatus Buchananbacteria bacterium CG10_big_fil_rev_8_21_14_0_10_33_19 TaxID=1974525 RepID=A0A2H0W2X2_9BACT|nr:hypothetical protein [Candidatus Falkowbacteria bacterium]PIS05684.1 MAG: hypothetical protein COT80_02850 [Candidatus Buchananbacteria bacterium CG10_big_fil_rev_8_21_14_0_10_33_19]